MKNTLTLACFLCIGLDIYTQEYSFIPEGLSPIPITDFQKPEHPLDIVYYEDGTIVAYQEAMKMVKSEQAIPNMFADSLGNYKALVISKKIEINYPGIPEELKSLGCSFGNSESDKVVICSQGGSKLRLANWKWQQRILNLNDGSGKYFNGFNDYFFVNVKQAQMIKSDEYRNRELSFVEAKDYDAYSIEILWKIVEFFKSQDKKVYLSGVSGGAFLITELIAAHGNMANGYLIMHGRLDMNDEMWKPRLKGELWHFRKDGKTIYKDKPFESIVEKNRLISQAAGTYKRYTKELDSLDLTNVIYFYGKTDDKVGSLLPHEIDFLNSHGAYVVESEGDHGAWRNFIEIGLRLMLLD